MNYIEWSGQWENMRERTGDVKGVIDTWKIPPPKECLKRDWVCADGPRKGEESNKPRKSTEGRGDERIERWFLGTKGARKENRLVRLDSLGQSYLVTGVIQNMGLATKQKKNRIADCLGIVDTAVKRHPLAVEVKLTADKFWYAVVENLQQVRMLRRNVANVQRDFAKRRGVRDFKGAWGLVLVPESYLQKHKHELPLVEKLLRELASNTTARIIVGKQDEKNNRIVYVCGYWPTEPPSLHS